MDARINKIAKYSSLAAVWAGKGAIVFILVAVLGYTQGLYAVDVQLRSSTPMVQVNLIVFDSMPHLSLRKLVNFTSGMFHLPSPSAPTSREQACRQMQKPPVG